MAIGDGDIIVAGRVGGGACNGPARIVGIFAMGIFVTKQT